MGEEKEAQKQAFIQAPAGDIIKISIFEAKIKAEQKFIIQSIDDVLVAILFSFEREHRGSTRRSATRKKK